MSETFRIFDEIATKVLEKVKKNALFILTSAKLQTPQKS